jgi:hypothetical protein
LYEALLASEVRENVKAGKKLKHSYEDVAKDNGISAPTVRRAWKKYLKKRRQEKRRRLIPFEITFRT